PCPSLPEYRSPLTGQDVLRDTPTTANLAQEPLGRHEHVVEKGRTELVNLGHRLHRPCLHSRAVHVDQKGADSAGTLAGGGGKHPAGGGVRGEAGPQLLPGDPPPAVAGSRGRAQRSQVASRLRFGEPLTPELPAAQQVRKDSLDNF